MKHKVSTLEGALLDAAVAKAWGLDYAINDEGGEAWCSVRGGPNALHHWTIDAFNPSANWQDGGPLIERERIEIAIAADDPVTWSAEIAEWVGGWRTEHLRIRGAGNGPTPLIAAMRAFVASKRGEEVELP